MSDSSIYNIWTEFITNDKYKVYFLNNLTFIEKLDKVKKYIDENKCKLKFSEKNKENKMLYSWLIKQHKFFKNKENKENNNEIYLLYLEFINDKNYEKYFNKNINWFEMLEKVIKYFNSHNKRPQITDNNKENKNLCSWISQQLNFYKNKENIMKNDEIYNTWSNFTKEYSQYFNK